MKVFLISIIIGITLSGCSKDRIMKVGYLGHWGSLAPPLQNTAYADEILGVQFESLIQLGSNGEVNPSIAKSWTISEDQLEYTFHIDTAKKFSDGTRVTAYDVKQSWEYGLQLTPIVSNSGLKDALSFTVGFEDFDKTKKLSGVIVKNDSELVIKLNQPYRMLLLYLSGTRYAIYKISSTEEYIGTGTHRIIEKNSDLLLLEPVDSKDDTLFPIEVTYFKTHNKESKPQIEALSKGKLDVIYRSSGIDTEVCKNQTDIKCQLGEAQTHVGLFLNSMEGTLLNDVELRQALFYILFLEFNKRHLPSIFRSTFKKSMQTYLGVSLGSLSDTELAELAEPGKQFIQKLQSASKNKPLVVQGINGKNWLAEILSKHGIKISINSNTLSWREIRTRSSSQMKGIDIILRALSVGHSDPDAIYHFMGKEGAISKPFYCDGSIENDLVKGKSLTKKVDLDKHYKNISRSLIKQVPYIHLGFLHRLDIYNDNRVKLANETGKRTGSIIQMFTLK